MKENDEYYLDYSGERCIFPDADYFIFDSVLDGSEYKNIYYPSLDLLLYYWVDEEGDDWHTYEEDGGYTKNDALVDSSFRHALRLYKIRKYKNNRT
jgi:hypothetical protein